MADSIENVIVAAKEDGRVEKLIVMSMFGAGESFGRLVLPMRWALSKMGATIEDHNQMDETVKESGLTFVLVRATMLRGENSLPVREFGDEGEGAGWLPSISRRSVAGFLLDAVEGTAWDRRTPVVAS